MDPEASDPIRRLEEEHRMYEAQLESLLAKPYPSADDMMEEVRLKKLKLRAKDELEAKRGRGTGSLSLA